MIINILCAGVQLSLMRLAVLSIISVTSVIFHRVREESPTQATEDSKKSRLLVEKLLKLTSEPSAAKLKRNLHTSGRVRSANEKGYYIVDAINEAINSGKQISFFYTDFDGRKKQFLRNEGKPYIVSPYTMIWNGDYYYLVGWNHEQEETRTYRVDRILKTPDILNEDTQPVPENFDVARYTREVFRMYDNEEPQEVTLLCANEVMKGVLDKFGMDITVKKADPKHFRTKVKVCTSPTFYSWVFQWGERYGSKDRKMR